MEKVKTVLLENFGERISSHYCLISFHVCDLEFRSWSWQSNMILLLPRTMAVYRKKSIAIQGLAFLISLSGNKEDRVMGETKKCQFLSESFCQCRAQTNWQLSFGQGTQAAHCPLRKREK